MVMSDWWGTVSFLLWVMGGGGQVLMMGIVFYDGGGQGRVGSRDARRVLLGCYGLGSWDKTDRHRPGEI